MSDPDNQITQENDNMDGDGEGDNEENQKPKYPNLTQEKVEEVEDNFDWFDKAKINRISFFDLKNLLRVMGFNPTGREIEGYQSHYDKTNEKSISLKDVKDIVNKKICEPDTIEELIEAMKVLDTTNDGTIQVPELRWAMTQLGDVMDPVEVDKMISELDSENKGFVDILEFSMKCFNIKKRD